MFRIELPDIVIQIVSFALIAAIAAAIALAIVMLVRNGRKGNKA